MICVVNIEAGTYSGFWRDRFSSRLITTSGATRRLRSAGIAHLVTENGMESEARGKSVSVKILSPGSGTLARRRETFADKKGWAIPFGRVTPHIQSHSELRAVAEQVTKTGRSSGRDDQDLAIRRASKSRADNKSSACKPGAAGDAGQGCKRAGAAGA